MLTKYSLKTRTYGRVLQVSAETFPKKAGELLKKYTDKEKKEHNMYKVTTLICFTHVIAKGY